MNADDVGKVIGAPGRTAPALRTVIGAGRRSGGVRVDFVDVDRLARRGPVAVAAPQRQQQAGRRLT